MRVEKISYCANCAVEFRVIDDNVLYCSEECEREHDLFRLIDERGEDRTLVYSK
ncbi:MYND finger family protein (plasmid) [Anoxybacillus sp. B7M1]|nr:MYND finger family protein [Anoxybacillus sp. B7M1]